ncbi:MAG: P22 phage major capsid protein family protein [Bradymonadaceae bacterium]
MAIGDTEADPAYPEFWLNEAHQYLRANTVMPRLVRTDLDDELAEEGDAVNITELGGLTVRDKQEDTSITTDSPSNSTVQVTLDQHKYIAWTLEDTADAKAVDEALDYLSKSIALLAEEIDKELLGLYSSVATQVGSAGTDVREGTVIDARQKLNDLKAPMGDRALVVSSKDEASLLEVDKFTEASSIGNEGEAIREAQLGRLYGFDTYMSQLVQETGSSPVQTHNIAFDPDAFVLASRPLPQPTEGATSVAQEDSETGIVMRYTRQYSIDKLATTHVIDVLYGTKAVRADELAVEVLA